jgi:SAM-dependent methyltransferase
MNPMNAQFYETIARFYDAENAEMTDDLVLYSELADETGDPVLDVGCGTGRVMLHLAQDGHRVIGVDRSREMLARGQRKLKLMPDIKPLATFIHGDAVETKLSERFKLVIVSYNSLLQFQEQIDQLTALRHFASQMDDDGLLVLDMPNAGEAFGSQDPDGIVLERMFIEPETGHTVMQNSVSNLDRVTQQLHITWIYDEIGDDSVVRRTFAPMVLRYIFSAEMDLMLAAANLRRVQTYGDYMREPFVDGSPRMIVLAQKAETSR